MFSTFSQIGKTLTDEISRINEEVNNPKQQKQQVDSQVAAKILNTKTPDLEDITKPDELSKDEPESSETRLATSENMEKQREEKQKETEIETEAKTGAGSETETEIACEGEGEGEAKSDINGKLKIPETKGLSSSPSLSPSPLPTLKPSDYVPGTKIRYASLIPEIRSRMLKFAKYEKKYPQLYEAYKIEKRKSILIASFEKMLKEQTPYSSIGEIDLVREYFISLDEKNSILNKELSKITKEKNTLDNQLYSLNNKIRDLQKALTQRNTDEVKELNDLKNKIDILEKSKLELQEKTKQSESTKKELEDKVTELESSKNSEAAETLNKEEIEKILKEKEELVLQIKKLKEEHNKENENFEQLKKSNQIQNEKIKSLEQSLQTSNGEVLKLKSNVTESNYSKSKIEELEKSIVSTKKLSDLFKAKVQSLTDELKQKEENELKPQIQSESLSKPNNKKGKKHKKGKQQQQPVKKPEDPFEDTKTTETIEVEEESKIIPSSSNSESDFIELRHKFEEMSQKFNDEQKSSSELKKSIHNRDEEVESLKDMLREVGDSLVQSQNEVKKIKEQGNDSELLKSQLDETKSELESKLAELEMLRLQNSNALSDYEKTKNSISKKLEIAIKDGEELKQKMKEKELNLEKLRKINLDLNNKIKDLENHITEIKNEQKTLNNNYETKSKALESINIEKQKLEEDLREMKKNKTTDIQLKLDLSSVKTSLSRKEKILSEAESRIKFLEEEKTKLNDSLIELKVQTKELKLHEKTYLESKNNLMTMNESLRQEVNEYVLKLNKLGAENNKLVKNLEELQDKYHEAKDVKVNSSNQVESIKKRVEELTMRNKEYESRVDLLEEELTQSRNMLQERTRESGTMRKLLMDSEENQDSKLRELQAKLNGLLEEKENFENESTITLKAKQKELEDIKRKQDQLLHQIDNLTNLNNELETKIKELSKKQMAIDPNFSEPSSTENDYTNKMIESLRGSLRETEKRLKEMEELNGTLRKSSQESSEKLIRLNKKYKIISQQYRRRMSESTVPSPINSRHNSISVVDQQENTGKEDENKERAEYIKNVLLGFLEHKEQRNMLLPVIKTLLYLSDDDEKKLVGLLN